MAEHYKYPKTPRVDAILANHLDEWKHLTAIVEEKVDGSNAAIHFENGQIVLQSRGHVLIGGARELLFNRFKGWAFQNYDSLYNVLGENYVVFGEWCYAKHCIFYDALPSFFIEFDILEKSTGKFLSTPRRRQLCAQSPLVSVAVLHSAKMSKVNNFAQYIGKSHYKTDRWRDSFHEAMTSGLNQHYHEDETDNTGLMEGIYIKVEDENSVIGRMKLLRSGLDKIRQDDDKWLRRPLFPNKLK